MEDKDFELMELAEFGRKLREVEQAKPRLYYLSHHKKPRVRKKNLSRILAKALKNKI